MLRYVVVCDACRAELRELETHEYRPQFNPGGTDAAQAG